jgi:hypothetical protein
VRCYFPPHTTQEHVKGHRRERLPRPLARENAIRIFRFRDCMENYDAAAGQRYRMRPAGFHSFGGYIPDLPLEVDLRPAGALHFSGTSGRQNQEF